MMRRVGIESLTSKLAIAAGVVLGLALAPPVPAGAAAAKSGGTCPSKSVGAVTRDAKGQPLVCTKISRTKFQWKLPALGSYLRPVPLGQSAAAGPSVNRFSVRVLEVDTDAAPEVVAENQYATPPEPGQSFVRVNVQATFQGPAATGSTGHYWYARGDSKVSYTASAGCAGFGTTFDVAQEVAVGQAATGLHCFQVDTADVASLRLYLQGSDRGDVYFSLH